MIVKRGSGSDSTWTFAASARDPSLRELTVLGEATFNPEFYLYSASLKDWSQLCKAEDKASSLTFIVLNPWQQWHSESHNIEVS